MDFLSFSNFYVIIFSSVILEITAYTKTSEKPLQEQYELLTETLKIDECPNSKRTPNP